MPFPPQQVFIDYLDLYYEIRAEDRNSWKTTFQSGFETAASFATGSAPVVEQIENFITITKSQIQSAKDFNDWFGLIFDLRDRAEKCQGLKRTNGESLACSVFHGLASLILQQLELDEKYKPLLEAEIQKRSAEIQSLEAASEQALKDKRGQGVEQNDDRIKLLTSQLAQLGQIKYIRDVKNRGMFSYLPKRDDATIITYTKNQGNKLGLLELQTGFSEWLYCQKFQMTKKHISYEQFLQDSADKYYQREKERKAIEDRSKAASAVKNAATTKNDSPAAAEQDKGSAANSSTADKSATSAANTAPVLQPPPSTSAPTSSSSSTASAGALTAAASSTTFGSTSNHGTSPARGNGPGKNATKRAAAAAAAASTDREERSQSPSNRSGL